MAIWTGRGCLRIRIGRAIVGRFLPLEVLLGLPGLRWNPNKAKASDIPALQATPETPQKTTPT
jgi:hypothetical protein